MADKTEFLSCLGLAKKAGKLVVGWDRIEKSGLKFHILIISNDISERTRKNAENLKCELLETELPMETVGASLGVKKVAVAAVCDSGFAKLLKEKYKK